MFYNEFSEELPDLLPCYFSIKIKKKHNEHILVKFDNEYGKEPLNRLKPILVKIWLVTVLAPTSMHNFKGSG